eukprot:COSAG01_NODE_70718_length_258_cov_0.509434_2_plen_29_part_01
MGWVGAGWFVEGGGAHRMRTKGASPSVSR